MSLILKVRSQHTTLTLDILNEIVDFETYNVRATKHIVPWPNSAYRRACVNSFGYGGSNAVVVLDEARHFLGAATPPFCFSHNTDEDVFSTPEKSERPYLLVVSANDKISLLAYQDKLYRHLIDPHTSFTLRDLAYTLSERRTRFFHRSYVVTSKPSLAKSDFVYSHPRSCPPRIGFIFTGQGAQWPQMGKRLVDCFHPVRELLQRLDAELQSLPDPPQWSLLGTHNFNQYYGRSLTDSEELTLPRRPEILRSPEFAQPLLTALQLSILELFDRWNIRPQNIVGHSSGEIAAAVSAGLISPGEAIKNAYYRGKTIAPIGSPAAGMLAAGLGHEEVLPYLIGFEDSVEVACINSPESTTLSGCLTSLEGIQTKLKSDNHFTRLLHVDMPYHSQGMRGIAVQYRERLEKLCNPTSATKQSSSFFSSVTGHRLQQECDTAYWERNMVSPVLFHYALENLLSEEGADILIEIGPSAAMAGPIAQILKSLPAREPATEYYSALKRGSDGAACLLDVAGRLHTANYPVRIAEVNGDSPVKGPLSVIVDLPNYQWNHSIKYWQESEASKDWRFRTFPPHDLLGSKVLGTSWQAPSWKATIRLHDLPWLMDHKASIAQAL